MSALAPLLQAFFTDRLAAQRHASPHTIVSYRDAYRLLLDYATATTGKKPSTLDIADLNAPLIASFLDHLERDRHNSVRTRNNRLAAIHSLFGYAALHHPEHADTIQRVLAIPVKRYERTMLTWLTETEVDALLAAPDRSTWTGRRDHALLVLAVQTGLRISELIGLNHTDIHLSSGAHVRCMGKGRKERATPLTKHTVAVLHTWLDEQPSAPTEPVFPTRTGRRLSRDALEHRLAAYLATASTRCRSLHGKRVTMHTLRHTAAMRLLQSGADTAVIALWLGHEQLGTVQIYLHADMEQKERAIARSPRQERDPVAINPRTRCWPSCNSSDHADLTGPHPSAHTNTREPCRHNPDVGMIGVIPMSALRRIRAEAGRPSRWVQRFDMWVTSLTAIG